MVVYDCEGNEPDEEGVCPEDMEQIEIWGHRSVVDRPTIAMLMDISKSRTCAPTDSMANIPQNGRK